MSIRFALAALLSAALAACGAKDDGTQADPSYEERLQKQLLEARPGDVITIPQGRFSFTRPLSLSVDGVTIRGAGMDKSVLTFKTQKTGAEGLLVTASDFTIEDLAIEDTIGDALKVTKGNNIVIRRVRTEWTGGPKTENGAYGIYPVQTTNVLMEGNVAIGASDAGIYVGQSKNVVIRSNRAEYNVAGIEIENTINADVYDNIATNNTGGILVFNMPGLKQQGDHVRVFRNKVFKNNTPNFGHKGTPVASVPAGSGIVVNSHDHVEIFDNEIADNDTANIIIASVYSTNYADDEAVKGYDPYPEAIYIHDNRLKGGGSSPDGLELKALKTMKYGPMGRLPDVLWDGYVDPAKMVGGQLPAQLRICIDNGDAGILNIDGPNDNKNPSDDASAHKCKLDPLEPVALELAG